MAHATTHFDDGAAYDLFMGRWSSAVGSIFLRWLAPSPAVRWLEVGCGSGAFTELVLKSCSPATIDAVDPSESQIDFASRRSTTKAARFRVADAQALPFPDAAFDVVASALVINFIPDRLRGLKEMRRVARPGGVVAGYVWDFLADRGPSRPLRAGMQKIGAELRGQSGSESTSLPALRMLFEQAGLEVLDTTAIDVSLDFPSFDEYWRVQTPPLHPNVKTITALPEVERARLIGLVRDELTIRPDGSVTTSSRANAIKARVPA